MADHGYIYAVSRIRSREQQLLTTPFLESLETSGSEEAAIRLLNEHGWGAAGQSAEEILEEEGRKTWDVIGELVKDLSVFNVFRCENDYHNLKAAIKEACTGGTHPGIYVEDGTFPAKKMEEAVSAREFTALPERMREPAERAMDTLLQTRDGQLCDCILDRAALEAIRDAGRVSGSDLLALYGELTAAAGDIKIAVRALRTGKDRDFLTVALADCGTLDTGRLADAASDSMEALAAYLDTTPYSGAVEELKKSLCSLERWCDDLMIEKIRPQLTNCFGLDPLAAYILARRTEIKSVRIILTCLRNSCPDYVMRERVRATYV